MKRILSFVFAGLLAAFSFGAAASAAPMSGVVANLQQTANANQTATVHKAGYRRYYRKRYKWRRAYRYHRHYRVYHPRIYVYTKKRRYKRRHGIYIRLY